MLIWMPAHSPRDAVVACANAARDVQTDLLVTIGGGSVTDGGKAVTICLEHDVSDPSELEPFRSVVENGVRRIPDFCGPRIRQIAVPTTLSAGEFNARAGVRFSREGEIAIFSGLAIGSSAVIRPLLGIRRKNSGFLEETRSFLLRSSSRRAAPFRA